MKKYKGELLLEFISFNIFFLLMSMDTTLCLSRRVSSSLPRNQSSFHHGLWSYTDTEDRPVLIAPEAHHLNSQRCRVNILFHIQEWGHHSFGLSSGISYMDIKTQLEGRKERNKGNIQDIKITLLSECHLSSLLNKVNYLNTCIPHCPFPRPLFSHCLIVNGYLL